MKQLPVLLRIMLWFLMTVSFLCSLFFSGLGVWQFLDQKTVTALVNTVQLPPVAQPADFIGSLQAKRKVSGPVVEDVRALRAAEKIVQCMEATMTRIAESRDLPAFLLVSQNTRDWQRIMIVAGQGKPESYFTTMPAFVCDSLKNPKAVEFIDAIGIDQYVIESLLYLQNIPAEARLVQGDPLNPVFIEAAQFVRSMLSDPLLLWIFAFGSILLFLVFILLIRMTALHGKLKLIDSAMDEDLFMVKQKKTEPVFSQQTSSGNSEGTEKELSVTEAEVLTDVDPKMIKLTIANSGGQARSAKVIFTFFNEAAMQVGICESNTFVVPKKGVVTIRTEVPNNDGSWVKWRSEIVPL